MANLGNKKTNAIWFSLTGEHNALRVKESANMSESSTTDVVSIVHKTMGKIQSVATW